MGNQVNNKQNSGKNVIPPGRANNIIINKNEQNIIQNNVTLVKNKNYAHYIKYSDLVTVFKQFSNGGNFLNFNNFNQSILLLFNNKIKLPHLPFTYLSERLFNLMDKNSNGEILEKDFIDDMILVLSGTEMRQKLSFNAMLINKSKNHLDVNEILDFFINSWLYGFRIVYYSINNYYKEELTKFNIYIPKEVNIFEKIVIENREKIKYYIINTFYQVGIKDLSNGINLEDFKKWIILDHSLEINYSDKNFRFAMNLMCLDEVGFIMDK